MTSSAIFHSSGIKHVVIYILLRVSLYIPIRPRKHCLHASDIIQKPFITEYDLYSTMTKEQDKDKVTDAGVEPAIS